MHSPLLPAATQRAVHQTTEADNVGLVLLQSVQPPECSSGYKHPAFLFMRILENTIMLGKTEGKRRRGQQRVRWLDGIINSMDMSLSKLGDSEGQGSLVCCSPWGLKELDMI